MSSCLESKVRFDDSSIKRIFSDPGSILRDIQSFWEKEEPYKITKGWHEYNKIPINYEGFKASLREIEGLDSEKRRQHPVSLFRDMVMEQASGFNWKAIPHICSYLPDETPPIEVTVYFVAYIEPGAFARQGKIIMNSNLNSLIGTSSVAPPSLAKYPHISSPIVVNFRLLSL